MRGIRFLLFGGLALGGCVQYTPIELAAIPPSQEVRVHVTDEGALRLVQRLGRITDEVTASVAPRASDSIAVTIWLGKHYPGTQFENVRETVVFPRNEVTALRLRRLSTWRTAAASAVALAGTLWLADQIIQLGNPNDPDEDGTDPPPPQVTFFRIRLW
jgi:hypothetical protein